MYKKYKYKFSQVWAISGGWVVTLSEPYYRHLLDVLLLFFRKRLGHTCTQRHYRGIQYNAY